MSAQRRELQRCTPLVFIYCAPVQLAFQGRSGLRPALRVLLDELEVAGVGLGVGGGLGAEGQDDRAELLDGLGRVSRGGACSLQTSCTHRLLRRSHRYNS
jgi:hypothetical protein